MGNNGRIERRLGDLVEVRHGWPFKSKYFSEELTGRPIVVNIGNFEYTGGFRFGTTTVKEYRDTYPKEYELSPGEILLVMTCQTSGGEILEIPARVPSDGRTYLHNQRLGRVVVKRPDEVDVNFLYWMFLWPAFNRELFVTATGTKILHTAPGRIENFRFRLPPLPVQRRIANILGTLDDKIELNRRMNETLESMARRLFRSWFVDFDPVHAKAAVRRQHPKLSNADLSRRALPNLDPKIAELFPDSFADSTLGPIPIGWKVGSILETADLLSGGTPKTSEPRYWDGDIMWASAKDVSQCREPFLIDTERRISKAGLENSSTKLIDPYSTVVVSRGATTGRLAMFGDSIAMNQTCYALRTRLDAPFHLFCHAGLVMNELVQTAHGSVFDTITTRTFAASAVLIAPQELVRSFNRIITPVFTAILGNQRDATTLQTIRDKLLPRLLSGQLPVHDSVRL